MAANSPCQTKAMELADRCPCVHVGRLVCGRACPVRGPVLVFGGGSPKTLEAFPATNGRAALPLPLFPSLGLSPVVLSSLRRTAHEN
ncbi:MAG TPA: hypothetical protein VNO52_14380 [Methylomirabilota bacterium]|nr:hypothetical protein [Methylomirabilota bacterium]